MAQGPAEVILRMLHVLARVLNTQIPFYAVIANGEVNYHLLAYMERILYELRRLDLVHLFRQTMQGNLGVLETFESCLPFLDHFHEADHAAQEPEMCYWFSTNNNPVREEVRYTDMEAQSGGQGVPHRPPPVVRESRDRRRMQENQKESNEPHPPSPEHCVSCGENIQAVQRSRHVRDKITQIMKKLSPQELQAFIDEVNHYDREILPLILRLEATPFQEIINTIVSSLRAYNLVGSKCLLTLFNYIFQRTRRLDLASEIGLIRNVTERATPSLD